MGVDVWDIEGNAAYLYELAGADPDDPPGTPAIARAILGPGCIRRVRPSDLKSFAALARVQGRWLIYVRRNLRPSGINFLVGHELAEWLYRETDDPDVERACDALAAALVAPRRALLKIYRRPDDLHDVADALVCSETCAALRIGEALDEPIAVVAPTHIHTRPPDWRWPPESELRKASSLPGVARVPFTGDRRRFALMAAS